jgi:dTDP-4-dehydrorhamnose reductase
LVGECERRGWAWQGSYHEHPQPAPSNPEGLFQLELSDLEAVAAAVRRCGPDLVFLPSGWTWVDGCEDDPQKAMRINALAPEAVARECRALGARLVFYSTDYVFGENGGPYDELAPPDPLGAYGRSKLEGERRVLEACPAALVLRTTVVYGPEPQGKNFVYQVLKNLLAGRTMTLPQDQTATVTYNRDLARASAELAEGGDKGLWNVCGSELIARDAFGRLAAECFGLDAGLIRSAATKDLKQKARRPLAAGFSIAKLTDRLGWVPSGAAEGLRRMRAELEAGGQWERMRRSRE